MNRILALSVSVVLGGFAQMYCLGAPLLLKSGSFDPSDARVMARRVPLKTLATKPAKGGERVYIVQKDGLVDAAWRTTLTDAGAKILRYLPENAYLIRATVEAAAKIEQDVPHAYLGEYRPEYRLDAPMQKLAAQPTANKAHVCMVSIFDAADRDVVSAAIAALDGCKVLRGNGKVIRAELTPKGVEAVSALAAVEWVSPYRERRILNDVATEKPRMNVTSVWPGGETGLNLTGKGQVVAIADTGLDTGNLNTLHEDIRGRVSRVYARGRANDWSDLIYVSYFDWWSWQYVQGYEGAHGTHVAGSVLGNGKMSNGKIRGPAYEASLIFQSVDDSEGYLSGLPEDLNELFQQAYDDEGGKPGARIHSNSWGSELQGEYTSESQGVDEFMFEHPDMLILFSAANAGVDADGDGVIDLNSLGSPASAKNCLTVGAAESQRTTGGYAADKWSVWGDSYPAAPIKDDYHSRPKDGTHQGMAAFSSRGPCQDGRIKPDIVAPGTDILSTKVINWPDDAVDDMYWGGYDKYYAYMGGTSMATPLTSGAATLVRQWLVENAGLKNPDAATMKALMLAGAKSLYPGQYGTGSYLEIPKAYPNNVEGWGQVNLGSTVKNANGIVIRDGMFIQEGATDTYTVKVPMAGSMNIVMAYADAPSSPSSSKALVNDLDLLVKGPDGKTYYPNSGSSPDRVNNVEGIRFDAAKAGEYVITVKAYNIATPMSTSLTGGKSNATRYSLAVLGAQIVGDTPPTPVEQEKPDLRPWALIDERKGWTWSAPLVLQTEVWDPEQSGNLVGKTAFSANDDVYVNWTIANFSTTAAVKETFRTAVLIDGKLGKLLSDDVDGVDSVWTIEGGLGPQYYYWCYNYCFGKLSVGTHTVKLIVDYDNVVDRLHPEQNSYEVTITVTADGPVDPGASQYGLGQVSTIGEFPDPRVSSTIAGVSGLDGDNAPSRFDMNGYPFVLTDAKIVDAEKLSGKQVDYTWCQQLTDVDVLTFTGHSSAFGYDDEDDFADYLRSNPSLANGDLVAEALAKEGTSAALCRTWISSDYSKFADTLEENLADGKAMASVGVDFGDVVHVLAVCGYAIDTGYRPNDPDRLVGLYCIDSDDDRQSDVRTAANQIRFYYVYWDADERVYWMSRDYTWEGKSYDEGVILCDEEWGLGYVLRAKAAAGTVTVEFDANGGECATKSQNYTIGSKYGTLPRATKGDTMLLGWYTKRTGGKRVNAVTTVSADVTRLYARWQDDGGLGPQEVSVALGASAGSASSQSIANGGTQVTFKKVLFPTWVKGAKLRLPDGDETDVYKGLVKVDWDGDATLVLTAEANEAAEARTDKLVVNYSEDNTKVFCTVQISQAAKGEPTPSDTTSLSLSLSGAQWHKISFNVLPDDPSPAAVFGPVASKIDSVVKGSDTKFWSPGIGGSLASVEIGAAYWVLTTDPNVAWTVTGTPHPETEIRLNKGWTMIGYALAKEGPVASVLKTALATGKIEDIVDETLFYPGSLTTMKPGRAYWVNATEAMTIRYDAVASANAAHAASVHIAGTRQTRAFAARMRSYRPTVLKSLAVSVSGRAPKAGEKLAAYEDGTGEFCGECVALDGSGRMSGVVYVPDGARVRFAVAPSSDSAAATAGGPVLSSAVTVARSGETVKGQSVVLADPTDEIAVEVTRGVAVALPLVTEVQPSAKVRVSGLPAGLKFAAKDVVDKKTGETTVLANTVYGVPSAASRKTRDGAYVPSKVKVTLTEPGEAPLVFTLLMTVKPLPEWAVGTFDGACDGGVAKMTVSSAGRLSGKLSPVVGKAVMCGAPNFALRDGDRFYADVTFKAQRESEIGRIVLEPYEAGGLRLGRIFPLDDGLPFGFVLAQNAWKRTDIVAPKIPAAGVTCPLYGVFMGVTLKLRANGAVTVTDVRSGRKSVSSAQLLLEEGGGNTVAVLVNGEVVRLQLLVDANVVTGAVHVE